ncbi:hypothetical protein E4U60_007674 [Claviceps pazoutovae]|uniref:Frequency clock protein n=1 Tax=Claviceps pazoutovae TaxID=1649127 RepID=A0A9P7SK98_9HYPO|nr:hypothetical protein E4U60_007674 [Claviceps pazoutovae]
MASHDQNTQDLASPALNSTGQPLPRRSSPEKSVTLKHFRVARDVSLKASSGSTPAKDSNISSSPRRDSSGDSNETSQSDPKHWFDQSNENPTADFDNAAMDVDPPFYQKQSDLSNEDKPYTYRNLEPRPRLTTGQSSSADDYRSVIDDLTVEIQTLKEELKRYKQRGPDMMKKDKLFEIKYHGLPKSKRRELETTLRDFAGSIEGSLNETPSQRKKLLRQSNRDHMYSGSAFASKHASSSSGSNNRPVDSAYASMSSGANSSGTHPGRTTTKSRAKNDLKVESYLRDIPEGLYPRNIILTDREKKKLVVRRLEQLFTGKFGGQHGRHLMQRLHAPGMLPSGIDAELQPKLLREQQSTVTEGPEACREAKILPQDQQYGPYEKKNQSRDTASTSNSNGDHIESGANGIGSRSGANTSPTQPEALDQRPTRVKDLDPDRVQVPSENMDYIRHLGMVPPELLTDSHKDVQPDADGWVYLNLLCNLAQLHIVNVTPSFVRNAVTEISTKFQLSPDGRKIRWRGCSEGTRFSSDSSNNSNQTTPDTREVDEITLEMPFKRQKTNNSPEYESTSRTKFVPQMSTPPDSFHYKPLFARHNSPNGEMSLNDTLSSFDPMEESNIDESREGLSGSRKRRHDGAIIYYSGAPFCTDLAGDSGDVSPATYMLSTGQDDHPEPKLERPHAHRTDSGSFLPIRPLSDWNQDRDSVMKMDVDGPEEDVPDVATEISELEPCWSTSQQFMDFIPLEPCGLGGVMPDDHFMVIVTTKRHKDEMAFRQSLSACRRISGTAASTPDAPIEIEYLSGRIKRLAPVSLPPPVIFLPPFSSNGSSSVDDDDADAGDEEDGGIETSALSSGDQDDEEPGEDGGVKMDDQMDTDDDLRSEQQSSAGAGVNGMLRTAASSVATAGGVRSHYSSSGEAI